MRIVWSEPAKTDIYRIADYIAQDAPINAKRFIEKLKAHVDDIAIFPRKHRVVPEYRNENIREVLVGDYRIIFQIIDVDIISIQAVVHGSRDLTNPENQPRETH